MNGHSGPPLARAGVPLPVRQKRPGYAALAVVLIVGLGMVGAYDAMRTGYVDETWAKEHHLYWYNDVKAGKDPSALVTPDGEQGTVVHANRAPQTPGRHA